ncbi:MAG: DNA replication/repair protein RecF, partial [Zhenhengia sp.]
QYVEYAKEVIQRRSEFIQEINEVAKKIHANISGGKEDLEVVYEPNVLETNIEEKVARYRQKDIMTQSSSVGPHRDDLKFLINGMDVKVYGSQGQQRTVVLSMKLAELRLMQENLGEAPILLLDDVLSELDDSRQKYLFSYTENIQTLITCTGVEQSVWNSQKVGKLYNVVKGNIY